MNMLTMLVTSVLVLCGILQTRAQIEGVKYQNSLLVSSTFTNIFGKKIHVNMLPGTLYDMIGEMNISTFSLTKMDTRIFSMEVDYNRQRLYMYDQYTAAIFVINEFDWKTNFTNINLDVFHNGVSRDHNRLGLDWVSGNVYWTDPLYKWIAVQGGDNYDTFKILIHDNLERPTALVVDPVNRYLFWSDIGSKTVKIERSMLSGADRKTIISTGLLYPTSIDVDLQGNKIVWVDADRDTLEIANFDGSERHAIRRLSHSTFYDIAVFKDLVCVTEISNSSFLIINKNNGVLVSTFPNPYGETYIATAIYSKGVQPNQNDVCAGSGCSDICVGDTSGPLCMCREGFKLNADNKTCSEDIGMFHRAVVWTNRTHLCLTDIRVLTTTENTTKCVYTQGTNITRIDIDMAERKVIFTDGSDILVLTLGTNTVRSRLISTSSTVTGLAVDWRDENVYWSEGGNPGRIKLVSQATGNDYTLVDTEVEPRCLHLQPLDNYMFWVSGLKGSSKVERSDLDGSNRMTIIYTAALTDPISLTSDSQTNRLYFIDGGFVKSCEPDGKDLKAVSVNLFGPHTVFLYKNYLVLADSGFPGMLKTMDKTGASLKFEHSSLGVDSITDMKVLDASLQLQQHGACDVYNGDCEHICIPIGRNRICQCEYGFQLDSNRQDCSSETLPDSFLLVTDWTHNRIYQVSLEDGEVRAVDTDTFGSPVGVAYNYMTQDVVWSTETLIHRLNFKTGEYKTLQNTESFSTNADRFAIDYTSGNLYYTAVGTLLSAQGAVAVLSPTGRHKILIKDGSKPRAIALDPEDGLMFWTDHDDVPFVKSANMDGTNNRTIVSSGIVWPNGLAIDTKEKILYITDGRINSVLRCTYTGSCVTYYRDAEAHLMDIKLLGDYLYYTAWNRVYITKLHKTDTTIISRVAERAELGRLDSLALYSSSLTYEPMSSACTPNNGLGPCSTFCFPKSSGYTCACEDGVALLSDGKTCTNAVTSTTTTTTTTTTPSTSTTTTTTTTVSRPQKVSSEKVTNEIPAAAIGGGAGGAAVLVIVIVIVIILLRRSGSKSHAPPSNPSGYERSFDMSSIYRGGGGSEVPIVQERPDPTYNIIDADLINFDEQKPVSGVYETLNKSSAETGIPDTRQSLAKPNDYLELPNTDRPPSRNASGTYLTPLQMEHPQFHGQMYQDESSYLESTQNAASPNPSSISVIAYR